METHYWFVDLGRCKIKWMDRFCSASVFVTYQLSMASHHTMARCRASLEGQHPSVTAKKTCQSFYCNACSVIISRLYNQGLKGANERTVILIPFDPFALTRQQIFCCNACAHFKPGLANELDFFFKWPMCRGPCKANNNTSKNACSSQPVASKEKQS